MFVLILFCMLIASMLFSIICGKLRYRQLDAGGKLIFVLLNFALAGELSAIACYNLIDEKAPVYHFTSVISLYVISLYFITIINTRHKRALVISVSIFLPVLGILNCLYLQDIHSLATNMLHFRSIGISVMCMAFLYKIFISDDIVSVYDYPHFWIPVILLMIYCFTYFFWSYVSSLNISSNYKMYVQHMHAILNILSYGSIGVVFLRYPKMIKNGAGL